jgi:hypothetical protein
VSKGPQVLKGRLVRRDHPVRRARRARPDYGVPRVPRATAAKPGLRDHLEWQVLKEKLDHQDRLACRGPRVMLAFPAQLG